MKNELRTLSALAIMFLMGAGLASPTWAQGMSEDPAWTLDARGGISVPAGDLADLPIDDVGPSFGAGVGYHLTPRLALRADGDVELFSGESEGGTVGAPDINLWHYNAGVDFELTRPGAGPWDVTVNVAGGATTWDTDSFSAGTGATQELSETYFTANGGLRAGYDLNRSVSVFLGGQWYLQFTDEEDTQALASLTPELSEGFDSASSIPLYAGLSVKF